MNELERTYSLLEDPTHRRVHWTAKSPFVQSLVGGFSHSAQELARDLQRQDGWDCFVSLNPCDNVMGPKPAKAQTTALRWIGIDVDPLRNQPIDAAICASHLHLAIAAITGRDDSTVMVSSGRGLWAWLRVEDQQLATPSEQELADNLIKGFTEAVATSPFWHGAPGRIDTACADLSRIVRCPGTLNYKTHRQAQLLLDCPEPAPVPFALLTKIAAPYTVGLGRPVPPPPISPTTAQDVIPHMNLTSRQFALVGVDSDVESRHRRLFSTAKNLHELQVPKDLASFVLWSGAERCVPNLNRSDPMAVQRVVHQLWR